MATPDELDDPHVNMSAAPRDLVFSIVHGAENVSSPGLMSKSEDIIIGEEPVAGALLKDHPWFMTIHISALVSLNISIVFSISTIIYQSRSTKVNFWKRRTAERLVIYLAVVDLLYRSILIQHILNSISYKGGISAKHKS